MSWLHLHTGSKCTILECGSWLKAREEGMYIQRRTGGSWSSRATADNSDLENSNRQTSVAHCSSGGSHAVVRLWLNY